MKNLGLYFQVWAFTALVVYMSGLIYYAAIVFLMLVSLMILLAAWIIKILFFRNKTKTPQTKSTDSNFDRND